MRDIDRAEGLLSLFTSPDNAAGIAGDLCEEQGQRGRVRFWRQVVGTAMSLGRSTLFEAPAVVLAFVALGCFLLAASVIGGVAAAGYLNSLFNPRVPLQLLLAFLLSVPTLLVIWWCGASLAGAWLASRSPQHGMLACVLLCCVLELLLLALGVNMLLHNPYIAASFFWIVGLTVPAFLLRGAARARRRAVARLA